MVTGLTLTEPPRSRTWTAPERDQKLVAPRRRGYRIANVELERDAAPFAGGDARHYRV
jgi:hypothetical protein